MKYIVLSLLILLTSCSAVSEQMDHPIFGYSYDIGKVKYDPIATQIMKKFDIKYRHYWIYADTLETKNNLRYIIAGGIVANYSDDEHNTFEYAPDFGVVIKVKDNAYEIIGTPDVFLYDELVPLHVRDQLIRDAVNKSIKSEGYEKFKTHISTFDTDLFIKKIIAEEVAKARDQ